MKKYNINIYGIILYCFTMLFVGSIISYKYSLYGHSENYSLNELNVDINDIYNKKQKYYETDNIVDFYLYITAIEKLNNNISNIDINLNKKFYIKLAKDISKREHISNWKILYSIWWRESNFNISVISKKNAIGLGQVKLNTAIELYDSTITKERLLKPIDNAIASAKIFKNYLTLFKGEYKYAIAAYSMGPAKIYSDFYHKYQPHNYSYVLDIFDYSELIIE